MIIQFSLAATAPSTKMFALFSLPFSLPILILLATQACSAPLDKALHIGNADSQYYIYMQQRPCDESILQPPLEGCVDNIFPSEGYPLTFQNGTIGAFPFASPQPEPLKWTLIPSADGYYSLHTDNFDGILVGDDIAMHFNPSTGPLPNLTISRSEFSWTPADGLLSFRNETKSCWMSYAGYLQPDFTKYDWDLSWTRTRRFIPVARERKEY